MRHLYSTLMYMLTPFILLRLWWKGRRMPEYRQRITERFCLDKADCTHFDIWIHAVSLGEVIAAIPVIDSLLDRKRRILITTMTPTGAAQVRSRFGEKVVHRYVPYDLPDVLRRFFKTHKPAVGVIMETELWPNLINTASRFQVPLLLINARLSQQSSERYLKLRFLFKPILNQFTGIFAQCADDAERFKALGANSSRVAVLGNVKFDLQTKNINTDTFLALKHRWGSERVAVMAASTHEDEEQQLLSRLQIMQRGIPGMVLLIAPRHPERFQKVFQLSQELGFNTGLRSQIESLNTDNDVVVLDSLGELLGFYQVSDYAFVGGSLVPIGGHNVLEPIAMRVPVLSGTHVHNFKTICEDLKKAQAIELVENADVLVEKIIMLHSDANKKKTLVDNASRVLDANKGAVARYVAKIESILTSV
jgi:3-deoxy-D-manno-octulosonic-acid transferase